MLFILEKKIKKLMTWSLNSARVIDQNQNIASIYTEKKVYRFILYIVNEVRPKNDIYMYLLHFYDGRQFDAIGFLHSFFIESDDEEEGWLRYFCTMQCTCFYVSDLFTRLAGWSMKIFMISRLNFSISHSDLFTYIVFSCIHFFFFYIHNILYHLKLG